MSIFIFLSLSHIAMEQVSDTKCTKSCNTITLTLSTWPGEPPAAMQHGNAASTPLLWGPCWLLPLLLLHPLLRLLLQQLHGSPTPTRKHSKQPLTWCASSQQHPCPWLTSSTFPIRTNYIFLYPEHFSRWCNILTVLFVHVLMWWDFMLLDCAIFKNHTSNRDSN